MKKTKKLFALLLALAMIMGISTTAFAAAGKGSITINTNEAVITDQTYTVYRIFDLESYNTASGAYAYKTNDKWEDWTKSQTSYVKVDEQGYVTWVGGTDDAAAAAFAKAALAYANENNISADGQDTINANGSSVTISNLELGYYLVDSTMGALCGLTTTKPTATINEKNAEPTVEKKVKEDSTDVWGDENDAEIGETVEFKATITAQEGAQNYVLHDTMSNGLTYDKVTKITLNNSEIDNTNYTVKTNGITDGCTFEVSFIADFCDSLKDNDIIIVYYQAVVNENAVIAGDGNPNTIKLAYGDTTTPKYTPDDTTITYVWELPVYKYTTKDGKDIPLAGAVFALYRDEDCTDPINMVEKTANTLYKVATDGTVTEITTGSTGKFKIEGLDAGTYYLKEITAPAGYNKLAANIVVVIDHDDDYKVKITQDSSSVTEVKVLNQAGTELPSTGGMGTTLFYVFGSIFVLAAVVLLVTKKRMSDVE